jgi:ketosteroid isomerase-like protein
MLRAGGPVGEAGSAGSSTRQGESTPLALVRRAYDALASHQLCTLEGIVDSNVEYRPVDGLGLVGETLHGVAAVRAWFESGGRRFAHEQVMHVRHMEQVDAERVLAVGLVSERGRTGGAFAATVAWVWHVSDGRIRVLRGYPSEADARRALSAAA